MNFTSVRFAFLLVLVRGGGIGMHATCGASCGKEFSVEVTDNWRQNGPIIVLAM